MANAPASTSAWAEAQLEPDDAGLRCAWTDLTPLLSGSRLAEYQRLACDQRVEFEEQFWWLADPLWGVEGNERRDEHFARSVQLRLDALVRPVNQPRHAELISAGWPNSWRSFTPLLRAQQDPVRMTPELRVRHELYVHGGYSFIPDEAIYREPESSETEAWSIEWDAGTDRMIVPETWYSIQHHQTAVLRRLNGLRVVSAARLPVIVETFDDVRATLALARPSDRHLEVVEAVVDAGGTVRASIDIEDGEWLSSIETLGSGWRGRARHGTRAPPLLGGFGISAPVLVDERLESGGLPLVEAILPSTTFEGIGGVGIYLEVYGVDQAEGLAISVAVQSTERSLFNRISSALGLTSGTALSVSWTEPAETSLPNTMSRYLTVDLSQLDDGEYQITVAVARGSGETATSSRSISVR